MRDRHRRCGSPPSVRDGRGRTRPAGTRAAAAAGAGGPETELLAGLRALVGGEPGHRSGPSSAGSPGRCPATPLEHLLPENGFDVAKFLSGTEGTLALTLARHRPPGRRAARHRARGARLPGHADGRRGGARPAAAPAGRARGPGLADGRRRSGPGAARPRCPACRAAAAGCSPRPPATRSRRRSPPRASSSPTARCLDSAVITGPQAAALWRIREDGAGLGGRTPAGAPAWPGWEDSAVPPASLGPYLRDLEALMAAHGVDGLLYGHFGDGCVHVRDRLPAPRPAARAAVVHRGRRQAGRLLRRVRLRRARRRPGPRRAAAADVLGRGDRADARGEAAVRPGQPAQPGRRSSTRRRSTPTCGSRWRAPLRRGLGFAYPHDAGDFTAAVHRCTGVGKCRADTTASGGVMCPSYLATRDEKDSTRGRARVLQELANGSLCLRLGRARGRRGARPVPVLQGLLDRLPGRRRHGHLQGRGALPAVPAAAPARRRTTRSAGCPAGRRWPRAPRGWPGWRTRRCAFGAVSRRSPSGSAASTSGATCRGSRRRASAGGSRTRRARRALPARPLPARHGPQARAAVGGHVHQRLRAPGRPGRRRGCSKPPATRSGSPSATSAAASPGSPPASWTGPAGSCAGRCDALGPRSTRASRSSASSRRAPPRCAPTRPSCCRATRAPRRSPAR